MRELVPFVLLACACGAAVRDPAPVASPAASTAPSPPEAVASAADDPAAFDELRALGATVAPGMREVTHRESAEVVELVRADARDVCVRVAFQAGVPMTAKLVDEAGRTLGQSAAPGTHGVLAEKGPVCVRKGEVVKGEAAPPGTRVRWMAWEAP